MKYWHTSSAPKISLAASIPVLAPSHISMLAFLGATNMVILYPFGESFFSISSAIRGHMRAKGQMVSCRNAADMRHPLLLLRSNECPVLFRASYPAPMLNPVH